MAVTITKVTGTLAEHLWLKKSHKNYTVTTQPETKRMSVHRMALGGTYDTGGFALTPNTFGMGRITDAFVCVSPQALTAGAAAGRFIYSGGNVLVSEASGVGTMAEKTNGGSMAAYTDVTFILFGY